MAIVLIAIWLILFGVISLVSTKVPEWIVPLTAIIIGLIIGFSVFRKPAP